MAEGGSVGTSGDSCGFLSVPLTVLEVGLMEWRRSHLSKALPEAGMDLVEESSMKKVTQALSPFSWFRSPQQGSRHGESGDHDWEQGPERPESVPTLCPH